MHVILYSVYIYCIMYVLSVWMFRYVCLGSYVYQETSFIRNLRSKALLSDINIISSSGNYVFAFSLLDVLFCKLFSFVRRCIIIILSVLDA